MKGCGAIGKVVAPDSIDGQFESSHRQILFTINCIEKTETKKKRREKAKYLKSEQMWDQDILTLDCPPSA